MLLAACADDAQAPGANTPTDSGAAPDMGASVRSCLYEPATCGAHPAPPHGENPGQVFAPFSPALKDCDLKPTALKDLGCGKDLLLLTIGAGWCAPCLTEMKEIEQKVHAAFCGRGLGIVSVIYQDGKLRIPTSSYCALWKKQFGLTFPVLLDQLGQTRKFMGVQINLPLNFLLEASTMKVLARWSGAPPTDLNAQLDAELKKRGL